YGTLSGLSSVPTTDEGTGVGGPWSRLLREQTSRPRTSRPAPQSRSRRDEIGADHIEQHPTETGKKRQTTTTTKNQRVREGFPERKPKQGEEQGEGSLLLCALFGKR